MQILVANLIFSQLSACSHNTFQYESKRQIAREQKNIANKRGIYCAFRDYPPSRWVGGIFYPIHMPFLSILRCFFL